MPTSSGSPEFEARLGPDLTAFLGEHTPFQAMADEELAELAAESELVEFPVGAIVADYATHVPDDVWMVRSGTGDTAGERRRHHNRYRRAGRHLRIHAVADRWRNGIRGARHQAQHADPAAGCRRAGPVRQACGSGVPGVHGVERRAAPTARRSRRRPTAGRSANWYTARCLSSGPTPRCATRCAG